jgi:hypothetical protein
MISIKTFSGQPFQTIHVTEDDATYNDLLKYIKIPPHPRFEEYNRKLYCDDCPSYIFVKPYIKLFHITNEVKLNDIIDFDSELTIGFYFKYYYYNRNFISAEKIGDDFNLPDTSTNDKCKNIIEDCPLNIIFISDKMLTKELCKLAVQEDGCVLEYVKDQTEEICKLAVQENGWALKYVDHQTEEICKLAVQRDGWALQFVKDQTEEICKLAVQEVGYALEYVKEQTEEICKLAVWEYGNSLRYVDHQTEEICKLAVQQYGEALQFVKEQTREICKLAVQEDGRALKYVDHQTEKICKLAVRQNGQALQFVRKRTNEVESP